MQDRRDAVGSLRAAAFAVLVSAARIASAQMTGNVDRLKADLHGDDVDKAVASASALGSLKNPAARDALMGALQLGSPPRLTLALLEALGQQRSRDCLTLLVHFSGYRSPRMRSAAIGAMADIDAPEVTA